MNEQILEALAPCGLSCEKCFAHENGEIRRYSRLLKEALGHFEAYATRFEVLLDNPIFSNYPEFKEMLDYFAQSNCRGCRHEQCKLFAGCGVRSCHQARGVDFCHACDAFPCDRTGFDEPLCCRWIQINERIRKIGLVRYYEETRDNPRY